MDKNLLTINNSIKYQLYVKLSEYKRKEQLNKRVKVDGLDAELGLVIETLQYLILKSYLNDNLEYEPSIWRLWASILDCLGEDYE